MMTGLLVSAQSITAISPNQAYVGDTLHTTITSSGFFLTSSSPQGNILNIILKNATDSVFAVSDSTDVVSTSSAETFWSIPTGIATGLYSLVVRVYNNLFSGPTTDYTLSNSFNITTAVWPGDADNNHIVDNNDLLPIGLGYGSSGTARLSVTNNWQEQSSIDWTNFFSGYASPVNYKYADCNGDGVINALDTVAILLNFNLTHAKTSTPPTWRSGLPSIIPVLSRQNFVNGDTFTVAFVMGDTSLPANHVYGIAFTYNFDPFVIDSAYTSMVYTSSWFGSSTDRIAISKAFGSQGQIKIALTRIDHNTRSGNGTLCYSAFKITTDNISGSIDQLYQNFGYISDITVVDSTGDSIPMNGGTDTSLVHYYPLGISTVAERTIRVVPNPANAMIAVSTDDVISDIRITDINGQTVNDYSNIHSRTLNIDISTYVDGLYFVQVRTTRGVKTVKLLVAR
jgi:hypothetical protein